MSRRFDERSKAVDQRFEYLLVRFDENSKSIDQRFKDQLAHADKRFDAVDKRFSAVQWMMGVGFIMIGTLIAIFGLIA